MNDFDYKKKIKHLLEMNNKLYLENQKLKETRGGKRPNSGAKQKGNVQYQRRINPALVQMMDEYLNQLKNKNYDRL